MAEYGTLERKDSVPGTTMIQRDNNHRPASMKMRQGLPRAGHRHKVGHLYVVTNTLDISTGPQVKSIESLISVQCVLPVGGIVVGISTLQD